MTLRDLIGVLTKRLWLLIVGTTVAMAGTYFSFRLLTPGPRYQARATVIIGDSLNRDWASLQVSIELTPMYVRWATQRPVLQGVVDALSLPLSVEELRDVIDVRIVGGTQVMEISATSGDAQQAAAIANEVIRQLEMAIVAAGQRQSAIPAEIVQLEARISAGEAELIRLSDALANYRPTSPGASDIAPLETRISDTEAQLVALTERLLKTDSTEEVVLLTSRINALRNNLEMWRGDIDRLYARAESDSEAEIGQLVRRINVLQSNLGIWQREYSSLRVDYPNRSAISLVVLEYAQAPSRAMNPQVNILVAGITGLVLTTGAIFLLETQHRSDECTGE